MESLLFVTWDGPQVNYLEGLFFPILNGLKARYRIHVVQFTWGEKARLDQVKAMFESNGMSYVSYPVTRKPVVALGTLWTLMAGRRFLKEYITCHQVDILFPRTTFPAWMVSGIWNRMGNRKLIFDMDGFPLEERVDFSGLNPRGFQYRFLKRGELFVIGAARVVLVRTRAAMDILAVGDARANKFHMVINGRDSAFFVPPSGEAKRTIRKELGVGDAEMLLVYSGSLGPQYCITEMLTVFEEANRSGSGARFLVLTGNPEYLDKILILPSLKERMIIKTSDFSKMPFYLGAADVGLAIRASSYSMKGVAPVKLGEYLLCGLPVIASRGIGDTESLLSGQNAVYLLPDHGGVALRNAALWAAWAARERGVAENARRSGLTHFSLEKSIGSYMEAFKHLQ